MSNIVYIGSVIGILFFIAYLIYQVKIKNNKNYPIVLAMTLGSLTFLGNMNIKWIIENINKYADINLSVPEKISSIELFLFLLFLYGSIGVYYKFVFNQNQQKNTVFSFFIKGNVEQKNESNK
ncbi:hypothetical protein [Sulfurovum sp.]|jgi:hypothetical protein|uniref:hypothetical protein n=1 Tax=Sulfurovum sp. TaxID=1969726 RepID=UPI002A367FCB|nr:hypothetical protein [Sulfurovum sp.]MDY0403429.1 hypothetical protein [Sulfurovum sp.]